MTLWTVFVLAIVQGLTEFIPISSSAHLVFAQNLLGFHKPLLFVDVLFHGGTLLSVFIVFRRDLHFIWKGFWQTLFSGNFRKNLREAEGLRCGYLILVASIPTAILGLCFHEQFELAFGKPRSCAVHLIITGILLWLSGLKKKPGEKGIRETTTWMALAVGLAQGLAILPGISRSGSTIVVALFMGLSASWAAHFSFLMSIPAILGAIAIESKGVQLADYESWQLILGFITAFVVGVLSLKIVIKTVEKGAFRLFSYYAIPVGVLAYLYFTFVS